ncbi:hypothetical protein C4J88_3540 [Pseudomonas sp. R4-39-08]|uniref:glutaminyl-peptide cyclotransferase n=1 Tax=Pseudomonas sp. R4-39-08 TaxID=1173288 RepID=UPI000F56BB89|nr:glutaminyl-peptide cyclotransferase [Pseudomonas sp. R4-39-08]AZF38313.1 hypothetical protein C4J88_3540 [Pseudomonas sp. R4-39-08]
MKDVVIVVSRNDYTSLLKQGELIEALKGRNVIYIFSVRCAVIPHATEFEELHLIDIVNSKVYLLDLLKFISLRYTVTDIVSTGEEDLAPAAYARNAFNLKGISFEQSTLYRNKLLMKERLVSTDIQLPTFSSAADVRALSAMLSRFGKIIVKPKEGYSSKGIMVISTPSELDHFLSEQDYCIDRFVAEEFIDLDVYHLDAVVVNGEILFSTLGRYHDPLVNFSTSQWLVTSITNQTSALHEQAKHALLKILHAFETCRGVFHFEFFSDGTNLIFCEIAIRPAGGGISDAIYEGWGIHLHEVNVQLQLAIPFTLQRVQEKHVSIILMMNQQSGVVTGLMNQRFLQEHAHTILKRKSIGDRVSPSQFSSDSVLNVVLVSDDVQSLHRAIRAIISKPYYQIEERMAARSVDTLPQKEFFNVVRVLPHNQASFTQGLIIDGDYIVEVTGLYEESKINVIELSSGRLVKSNNLPDEVWGEGLAKLNGKYYVLTFKEHKALVVDPASLSIIDTLSYEGEGWGLTTDGICLVMSNGTDEISFRDPADFSVQRVIQVTFKGKKVSNINDLEWVNGFIYANVWYAEVILIIDPQDGRVIKWVDMAGMQFQLDNYDKRTNTLNGIAYDRLNDRFYVTGKKWSNIFAVKFIAGA